MVIDDPLRRLAPVERRTTPGIIADQLRERILDGTLPPGTQLGEVQISSRLQVSRGPVREAMQRLIQEGLLESRRHRGVFVIRLDAEDVADIYATRGVIERAAAAALLDRDGQDAFAEMAELLDGMADAAADGDWGRLSDLDLRFHATIVRASRSKRLQRMFDTLLAETRMCLAALEPAYPQPQDIVEEHTAMLDALVGGRRDEALERIDAHMARAEEKLRAVAVPDDEATDAARPPATATRPSAAAPHAGR